MTGNWQATSTSATVAAGPNGYTGTLSGGRGVLLSVRDDGMAKVNFSSMQPIDFTITDGGATVEGQYSYHGTVSGTLRFPGTASPGPTTAAGTPTASASVTASASASATSAAHAVTGTWTPAGAVTWKGLRLTLKLTRPVNQVLLNNADIGRVTGGQTGQAGNAVDLQPVLRAGTYTCGGRTLVLRPQVTAATVTWVFARA